MKKIFFLAIIITSVAFTACGNAKDGEQKEQAASADTAKQATASTEADVDVKTIQVSFNDVDVKTAASMKAIVDHYLHVKNALTNDNAVEAAKGGDAMAVAIGKLDKSLLSAEQKKLVDDNYDDLKEHAEHIGKNGSNIKHQREHFATMSEEIYALAKAFGGGRPLYHDHCPMYNDNKGGMWLSETKEVKNPYFGSEMLTCGKVQELIQ